MYHVAICEDEQAIREDLCRSVRAILDARALRYEVNVFPSAEELEEVMLTCGHPFDLLLLDVQLGGKSGMDLAIGQRKRDDKVGIVFITGSEQYALEGYQARPIDYLMKPVNLEALARAIDVDLKRRGHDKSLVFQEGRQTFCLNVQEICNLESYNHGTRVHIGKQQPLFFSRPLTKVEQELPPGMFVRCHNSFLVNLSYIQTASKSQVMMRNGEEIPVGRTYRDSFHSTFIRHFF